MVSHVSYYTLNTGAKIPSVGLGTLQAGPGLVEDAVFSAIKVGASLKKLFDEGVVKREDLFITSKLWTDQTLSDLQLDYLDLYLIHGPFRLKKGSSMSPENFVNPDIPLTRPTTNCTAQSTEQKEKGNDQF